MCPRKPSVNQDEIARRLNLARSTVTRILNNDPNYRASKETRQKVLALARELNYDFKRLRRIHRRRYARVKVKIPVRVAIVLQTGAIYDEGRGTIFDLNPIGALIGNFDLPGNTLPLKPFTLSITFLEGPLMQMKFDARVARIIVDDSIQMGVEFVNISEEDMQKIAMALQIPLRNNSSG